MTAAHPALSRLASAVLTLGLALSAAQLRAENYLSGTAPKAEAAPAGQAPGDQAPADQAPPVTQPDVPIAPIAPAMVVNGAPISDFEIDQRMAFLTVLQQKGDLRTEAVQGLISDRLQSVAAAQLGVTVTPEQIQGGMAEFAARAQMSVDQFLDAIAQGGVAPETFRDFVKAGILWRAAARAKFGGKIEVTEAEVDRALGMGASSSEERRLLLSELVITTDGTRDPVALASRVRMAIKDERSFAMMARQFSKATTASAGGELGWLDESRLPGDVKGALAGLHPGEMTRVLPIKGGAAIYFLRDEGAAAGDLSTGASVVDYAVFAPGTAELAARVSGCDGLYAPARKGAVLKRDTQPEASLPADLRAAVAGLDGGEARALPDGRLVMVCSRQRASGLPAAREAVRGDILNRKVSLLADAWMEELRFQAFIETP